MFDIAREGRTLKIKFYYHVPYGTDWTSTFENTYDGDHHAQLTYALLREAMESEFQKVRKEAYEQGWKDKSGKKRKQDWFSCRV